MSKNKENFKEGKVVVKTEPFYSDIIEVEFIDENGEQKKKQTFMDHDKFVKEEIVSV